MSLLLYKMALVLTKISKIKGKGRSTVDQFWDFVGIGGERCCGFSKCLLGRCLEVLASEAFLSSQVKFMGWLPDWS